MYQANAYRSTDRCDTWLTQRGYTLYDPPFNSMAAFARPGNAPLVFATSQAGASVSGGVYRSDDGGVSYTRLSGPLYGNLVVISPDFDNDQTVWVGAYNGLWRSTNAGASWSLLSGDLPAANVTGLAASPAYATDLTLFSALPDGANAGVYRSTDADAHWTKLTLPGGAVPVHVALSPSFAADQTVWVFSLGNGVFRPTDRGETWQAPTTVLAGCSAVAPGNATATDRILWAACGGVLYRSADEGMTWTLDGPADASVTQVAAFPDGATVFLGTDNRGIYRRERVYTVALPVVLAR